MKMTTASSITKAASKQTYFTIRFLVDRDRVEDAYRAYGYFRWVDDLLDADSGSESERRAFLERQKSLLEQSYRGDFPRDCEIVQEKMLVDLVRHDQEEEQWPAILPAQHDAGHGIRCPAPRQVDLAGRTERVHALAGDRSDRSPALFHRAMVILHLMDETRYLAVSAAHITHMLRDTYDDLLAGYFNIPREVLEANHIDAAGCQFQSLSRLGEKSGIAGSGLFLRLAKVISRVSKTCAAAWLALPILPASNGYWTRLKVEGYALRPLYNERKSIGTGLRMSWLTLSSMLNLRGAAALS